MLNTILPIKKAAIFFIILLLASRLAHADEANISDLIVPQQQRLLEAEMLGRDLEEFDQWRDEEEKKDNEDKKEFLKEEDSNKSCTVINFIEFNGNTLFSDRKLKGIIESYKYKCLSIKQINKIVNKISFLYYNSGYVTTQVYVKKQNVGAKTLKIQIIEGRIEDVKVKDNKINSFTLFSGYKGKILNIADIDQTTDNLLNIPSYQYKANIIPGTKPGLSIINIDGKRKLPMRPFIEFDNIGQYYTGHERYSVGTTVDNLFGLADSFNFKYLGTANFEYGDRYLRSFITSWSVPVKYGRFGFNFAYSDYMTTVYTTNESFKSTGQMINGTIFGQATIFRRKHIKTTGFINFNIMDLKSYVANTFSPLQSRTLMNSEIGINNNLYTKYGSFFHRISYIRGLGTIGADPSNQAMFDAIRFYQVYTIKSKNDIVPFTYQNTIDAQWASQDLYAQNQFVLGGFYSIRGFRDVNIYGSMGVLMRNDIDFALVDYIKYFRGSSSNKDTAKNNNNDTKIGNNNANNMWNKFLKGLTNNGNGGLILGLFYDIGIAGSYNQTTTASGTGAGTLSSANYGYLSGTGFKIRYESEHIQANIVFSKSLVYPSYLSSSVASTDNFIIYGMVRLVV